jgi:branched-chain amino acid transport system permease protein
MTLIGGYGTLIGPVLGSFLLISVSEFLRFMGLHRFIIYGIIVLFIVVFFPEGIAGAIKSVCISNKSKESKSVR